MADAQLFNDIYNYHGCVEKGKKDLWGEKRYQTLLERKDVGALSVDAMKTLSVGKYQNKWCGMPLMKGAIETTTYQLLLQEEKPVTIIELGTWQGTSAAWMADLSKVFGQKAHVYSVDIDNGLLNEKARRDNVTFIQGDCMKIEEVFPDDMLKNLPHPWFISEDAHVNVVGVLEHLLRFAQPGDMICVEDTSPDGPDFPCYDTDDYRTFGHEKLNQLKDFLKRNAQKVKIDRLYTDLFGYNGGLNWHGYMKVF
ncbi:uncharacterized protein LOC135486558 [Lineus longissimus]|uniref:uncharacterized protein LOC135486558 n=1 Tax=Lineus longissimus TaxID=88925 RepID=UPI002B4D01B9